MQPAMGSKPVFHMWFMHDVSWLQLIPFFGVSREVFFNLDSIDLV